MPDIQVPEITAGQLKEMLASAAPPFLLDVREHWEVAHGLIPGATHIPMNRVPDQLSELPEDKPIVVYCAAGVRSYAVAEFLLQHGFTQVKNLAGGMGAWAQQQSWPR